jgi:glycosyltransferase involved in cell wall biosynthesis
MAASARGCAILLSTYNGAAYLPALLESIRAQTERDWVLLWRDDGSRDETAAILNEWGTANPERLKPLTQPAGNLGVVGSFMALLRVAEAEGFAAAAFADQDDVWLPEKLAWALAMLHQERSETPALYCARQRLVDGALQEIGLSASLAGPAGFPASLTQNIATGNTVVLNRAAIRLIAPSAPPRESWHDWWCYLMVSAAGGTVLRDERPVILYRQHGGNVVGAPASPLHRALAALRRGPGEFMSIFRKNVAALMLASAAFPPATRQSLDAISEALAKPWFFRLSVLRIPGFVRNSTLQTALFRLWFLIG